MYWMSYTDHNNQLVSTEKKSYIRHFQVEEKEDKPGSFTGKTDFAFKNRIEEMPNVKLRDWIFNDMEVDLWESRPIFDKVREEGSEVDVDRVRVNSETGMPETETLNLGMVKIDLYDWLKKGPQNPTYSAKKTKGGASDNSEAEFKHKYIYFFPSSMKDIPECNYTNKSIVLKPKDVQLMVQHLESVEEAERTKRESQMAEDKER